MRISYDNNFLFTAGKDGTLVIHDIKDRDPRGGLNKRDLGGVLQFSEEILTEKAEMEEFDNQKETLENELQGAKDPSSSGVDNQMGTNKQEEDIASLQELLSNSQLQARNKYEQLNTNKADIEENYEKQIRALAEQQHEELEQKRSEYSTKMLEDASKYQELQSLKEEEARSYQRAQANLFEEHTSRVNEEQKNHNDFVEIQKNQIQQLKTEIKKMMDDNEETMKQIKQDADQEREEIEKKNQNNLSQVSDMGLKSKAELQITRNKLTEVEQEIEQLTRQIQDKKLQLGLQKTSIDKLKIKINEQKKEIHEKDNQIGDREKVIYGLKKKTQELEKFKFVLDYKIKELKRDIAPREAEIGKLSEQTNEMDNQLSIFNTVNSQLGFTVNELRER